MDISVMTVSIPVDGETLEEIKILVDEATHVDLINYSRLLNVTELTDYFLKGFCILVYNDDSDQLVGILTAIDRLGTIDYEWSALVLPSARKAGIASKMFQELNRNLELRGATADIALVPSTATIGQHMLTSNGYSHEISEITMVANTAPEQTKSEFEIAPFVNEGDELINVLKSAFGDTQEEAKEMISFNLQTPNRKLMLAKQANKVLGTATTVDNQEQLWITGLAVHNDARGKGVAKALLNWCKHEAYILGKQQVYLDVETDNDIALSVYQKQGFQTAAHTLFYRRKN
ncbi:MULTISPECIES: GNAT family N-acetyltransferase [unclassified Psychrobacillus]|uniref:GNAT family N-acetyltransferase n=1 Tax=unclassified Psychrobacillus TaxID=2636677 RepID=UPI0018A1EDCF